MKQVLSACCALAAVGLLSGCDAAWQSFEAIELGRGIPADSVVVRGKEGADQSREWQDVARLPFPLAAGGYSIKVIVNPDGRVSGKSYFALAYAHWVGFQTIAVRQVSEVFVPEDTSGGSTSQPDSHRLITHLRAEARRLNNSPDMFGNTERAPKLTLTALYAAMMCVGDRVADMDSVLAQDADSLCGIAETGFDRTSCPVCGVTVRIRNLDGRRLRVDMNQILLVQPFFPPL